MLKTLRREASRGVPIATVSRLSRCSCLVDYWIDQVVNQRDEQSCVKQSACVVHAMAVPDFNTAGLPGVLNLEP